MIYLSPIWTSLPENLRARFGYMIGLRRSSAYLGMENGYPWMLDNGAYNKKFDYALWMKRIEELAPYASTCLGIIIPDVVGNAEATLELWEYYAHLPAAHDFRIAFAAQDGMTVSDPPWDELDCLFIGGSTQWKYDDAWPLIREAKRQGKWLHVGRVNSQKAMKHFHVADSVDGTTLKFEPAHASNILAGLSDRNACKQTIPFWENQWF